MYFFFSGDAEISHQKDNPQSGTSKYNNKIHSERTSLVILEMVFTALVYYVSAASKYYQWDY